MDDSQALEPAEAAQAPACANCGQPPLDGNYPTPLCGDCREKFVRFPIPVWIWAFAAGILALMLFGFYKFPADLSLGIGLEKGRKASQERLYMTAERFLKPVADKLPGDAEANGRLLIAAFYNTHYDLFVEQARKMEHFKFEDQELFQEVDHVLTEGAVLIKSDSFKVFADAYPAPDQIPDTAWRNYFSRNPDDNSTRVVYASDLFNRKQYKSCDSVGHLILATYPGDFRTLMFEASAKREEGQYDSALYYNTRILAINEESVDGFASEARTLLRLKQDANALTEAKKGYDLDSADLYAQTSLILAYHFNGRTGDRDALIRKATHEVKDSSDKVTVQYALDVIEKKEKFRD
jgi:hypothetical protein